MYMKNIKVIEMDIADLLKWENGLYFHDRFVLFLVSCDIIFPIICGKKEILNFVYYC